MKTEPIEQAHYFKVSNHTKNLVPVLPDCQATTLWIETAAIHANNPTKGNYKRMMKCWANVRRAILQRLEQ